MGADGRRSPTTPHGGRKATRHRGPLEKAGWHMLSGFNGWATVLLSSPPMQARCGGMVGLSWGPEEEGLVGSYPFSAGGGQHHGRGADF